MQISHFLPPSCHDFCYLNMIALTLFFFSLLADFSRVPYSRKDFYTRIKTKIASLEGRAQGSIQHSRHPSMDQWITAHLICLLFFIDPLTEISRILNTPTCPALPTGSVRFHTHFSLTLRARDPFQELGRLKSCSQKVQILLSKLTSKTKKYLSKQNLPEGGPPQQTYTMTHASEGLSECKNWVRSVTFFSFQLILCILPFTSCSHETETT